MAARSRNASRRFAVMGIVGGLVFIAALIAFVLVPRQATRAAVNVTARLEERPDSMRTVVIRDRAAAGIAAADSALAIDRAIDVVTGHHEEGDARRDEEDDRDQPVQ